jgi:hypothetical protein
LFTVTLKVPLCEESLASRAAVREVGLAPVTLSMSAASTAGTLDGEMLMEAWTGLLTVNDITTDGFPAGFVTVTSGVPAAAMALAGMAACNSVGF